MGFEIPVDVDYFDHPKTLKLIAILGRQEADIYPLRLWKWAAQYARDGNLPPYPGQVERAIGWRGRVGRLFQALIEAGFIDQNPDLHNREGGLPPHLPPIGGTKSTFTLHDWMDRIGYAILVYDEKKRKQREKYAREHGILLEENRKKHPYPGYPGNPRNPGGETLEESGADAPPSPPDLASPGTDGNGHLNVGQLVGAFGFCGTPGTEAKAKEIDDLLRIGVTEEALIDAALAPESRNQDFYAIMDGLRKGRRKAKPSFRSSPPRLLKPTEPPCETCGGRGIYYTTSKNRFDEEVEVAARCSCSKKAVPGGG